MIAIRRALFVIVGVALVGGCGEPTAAPGASDSTTRELTIIPLPHPQQRCSESWSASVKANLGAYEFDKDLHDLSGTNYGLNEHFAWPLHVSSNVRWMQPHTFEWNSMTGDYLQFNSGKIEGNQGTGWWSSTFGPNASAYIPMLWHSGGTGTLPKYPTVDLLRFKCLPDANQTGLGPIRPIDANQRYDAAFFVPNDVLYFSVQQPANTPMYLTVDANAASDDADFDLYAGVGTTRPSENTADWADTSGIGTAPEDSGAALYIPKASSARTLSLGVVNYAGLGHVSIRANAVDEQTLTICTQSETPAQMAMSTSWWPRTEETIRRTLMRVLQMTNGNLFFGHVRIKLQSTGIQDGWTTGTMFCQGDTSCDWCMQAYGVDADGQDGCGFSTQGSTGRMRIPNYRCQGSKRDPAHGAYQSWEQPRDFSRVLAHEAGHALARIRNHADVGSLLHDQYLDNFHPGDSHTIMNGPLGPIHSSYRLSTDYNHCKPGDPQGALPTCSPKSDWTTIKDSGRFPSTWIYPSATASSQPWLHLEENTQARDDLWIEIQ
jgi:hypothetical protein